MSLHSPHARQSWRRIRHRMTSDVLRAIALTALLAVLFTLPPILRARRECERLRSTNGDLLAQLEALQNPVAAPHAAPHAAPPAYPLAAPGAATSAAPHASAALPSALPAAEVNALRVAFAFRPDGTVAESAVTNSASRVELAPFATPLIAAYGAMQEGRMAEAAPVFAALAEAEPDWPYGLYYHALATRDRGVMNRAVRQLERADRAGMLPLEGRLYLVLSLLTTGQEDRGRAQLTEFAMRYAGQSLPLGPLYAPARMPADLRRQLLAIPACGNLFAAPEF